MVQLCIKSHVNFWVSFFVLQTATGPKNESFMSTNPHRAVFKKNTEPNESFMSWFASVNLSKTNQLS